MSLLVSFCAVLFPRDVLDEIWDLVESVFEAFPTYFYSITVLSMKNYLEENGILLGKLYHFFSYLPPILDLNHKV